MKRAIHPATLLVVVLASLGPLAPARADAPKAVISQPLIADNQQFLALYGVTDNQGKDKNTYQNRFKVKIAATGLLFPFAQAYSSWKESEDQTEFANPAVYRAAVSINRGPWTQLTWGGQKSKECPFRDVIVNDPLAVSVKPGDVIYLRTEISVAPGGKWGLGAQAQASDPNPNWTEGGTNSDADVLLADNADFRPQAGLFTHTAQGVFGRPVEAGSFHRALILGDSISPYVRTAVLALGQTVPSAFFGQAAETGGNFWRAGEVRQKLMGGYDVLLYEYGVNDMRAKRSFEDFKLDVLNTWAAFRAAGGRHLIVFTLTPLSKSTDKWTSLAAQTPDFEPGVRSQWNDYVRSLTSAEVGMRVTVIDTAALFEDKPNDSLWKPLSGGKALTDDGCHPNGVGQAFIQQQIGAKIREAVLEN